MTLSLDDIIFRTRALAQAHPFSPRAQAYLNETVARERVEQPAEQIGVWAGHGLTVGYCLRCIEEDDTEQTPDLDTLPQGDLDALSTDIADRISGERAEGLLLYPEPVVVGALDRLIAGEVERRLSHWYETIDQESFEQLEAYIAWWTIKGYALRVAEQAESVSEVSNP